MKAAYFRELRPYSGEEVSKELGTDPDETRTIIQDLMNHGIVRYRTGDELDDEDQADEIGATDQQVYQFRYVGIVISKGHAVICYPKYIRGLASDAKPIRQMRQVLNVILRLGKEGKLLDWQPGNGQNDQLAVMFRLLMLYGEYGVYSNYEDRRVLNGNGTIDWTKTISMQTPVVSDYVPVYLNLWTHKSMPDETNLVTRLHRAILSECTDYLVDTGLSGLVSISPVELTEERPADLGDTDSLDWRLEQERASQYVTWKQEVIDLMRRYISIRGATSGLDTTLRLGTTSYYHAWEVACKVAFEDLLNTRICDLHIKLAGSYAVHGRESLLHVIPSPLWRRTKVGPVYETDTLIPDIVTFDIRDDKKVFCIYDAKYYVPSSEGKMTHQPGVESVIKQFLYQSAYRDFIIEHQFGAVVNAFLVPGDTDAPHFLGRAFFPGVMDASVNELEQFSNHIDMWAIPAEKVFNCYLEGRRIDADIISEIELL